MGQDVGKEYIVTDIDDYLASTNQQMQDQNTELFQRVTEIFTPEEVETILLNLLGMSIE